MTEEIVVLRSAIRPYLEKCEAGDCVIVAVSGGADSLALSYALFKEVAPLALRLVAVTIDHQLQKISSLQAEKVSAQLRGIGYEEVIIRKVTVTSEAGMEAGARSARYGALDEICNDLHARQIYLGHTRDDQAESVLLGLVRGSGTRSLSGMADRNGKYIRPFLAITREQTVAACVEVALVPWLDPHNQDPIYTRVRVRNEAIPFLEEKLGPGISAALARSAALFRADADALDEIAARAMAAMDLANLDIEALAAMSRAIRSRIIRSAIYAAGAPIGSISADHVAAIEALITLWRGQGEVSLPGGVKVWRISGRLCLLART